MSNTDIHVHIEVLMDGVWHHYANPSMGRSDIIFRLFAGLETYSEKYPVDFKPVPSIIGLPDNLSPVTRHVYERDKLNTPDIHHEGVATKDDLVEMQRILNLAETTAKSDMQKFMLSKCGASAMVNDVLTRFNPSLDLEEDVFHTYISGNAIHEHEGFDDVRVVFWFDS